MAKESKSEILNELNSHLAAASDCISFIRDKEVRDPESITKEDAKWASDKHDLIMRFMREIDRKLGK